MREITKTVSISIDGKPMDFRLTKLDAFSGAVLLRMLSTMLEGENVANLFSWLSDMDFSSGVSERVSGGVSLPFSLDFSKAKADLNSFLRTAGKTIRLHADASAVVSAGSLSAPAGPGGAFGIGPVSVCLDREVVNLAGILWYINPQQFRHLFIVLLPDGVDNDVPVLRQILP